MNIVIPLWIIAVAESGALTVCLLGYFWRDRMIEIERKERFRADGIHKQNLDYWINQYIKKQDRVMELETAMKTLTAPGLEKKKT